MARTRSSVALLALGFSTAACTTMGPDANSFVPNRTMNAANQPVVQRTDYVFDARTSGSGLDGSERERLDAWFQSLELGYGDRISIEDTGYGDPAARGDIAALASSYGLLVSEHAPLTAGSPAPGTVRVVVSRATANVPGCPDWSDRNAIGFPVSSTGSNYGCAVNGNLAAMIANPNDLVLGQTGDGTGDADTSAKAIRAYRDAAPTGKGGLPAISTKGN